MNTLLILFILFRPEGIIPEPKYTPTGARKRWWTRFLR